MSFTMDPESAGTGYGMDWRGERGTCAVCREPAIEAVRDGVGIVWIHDGDPFKSTYREGVRRKWWRAHRPIVRQD